MITTKHKTLKEILNKLVADSEDGESHEYRFPEGAVALKRDEGEGTNTIFVSYHGIRQKIVVTGSIYGIDINATEDGLVISAGTTDDQTDVEIIFPTYHGGN